MLDRAARERALARTLFPHRERDPLFDRAKAAERRARPPSRSCVIQATRPAGDLERAFFARAVVLCPACNNSAVKSARCPVNNGQVKSCGKLRGLPLGSLSTLWSTARARALSLSVYLANAAVIQLANGPYR